MGDEEETKINITYETLFEVLRREKNREELQKLSNTFFEDVTKYLGDKHSMMNTQDKKLFFGDDKEKMQLQIQNIKKILAELYERREKKIINMALVKSRTRGLVDTASMLKEENMLFDSIIQVFDCYRNGVLMNLQNAKAPIITTNVSCAAPTESKAVCKPEENDNNATIRFLSPIPKFLGPELEVYGPFDEDDVACLPKKVASVLVTKGRAEAMESPNTAVETPEPEVTAEP